MRSFESTEAGGSARPAERLRVLHVEDNARDAKLCARQLEQAGFQLTIDVVAAREAFTGALRARHYDLVLADYHLASWSGAEALDILRIHDADMPFILFTGTMGEDAAVECIKQGATDYVLKDRPARLPLAVKRALQERAAHEERRRGERARDLLASIVESSDDAIIGAALDGIVATWNLGAKRIYGYSFDEVEGKPISLLFPPGSNDVPRAAHVQRDSGIERFETTGLRKDGAAIDVAITVSAIRDPGGGVSGLSIIARDITERKRLQNEYYLAQKMEAIGRLAAGVAHDFNNLLTVIIGYGSLALARLDKDDELYEEILEVRKAGERAATLAHQLLAVSRKQVLQAKIVDFNAIVADMDRMLRRVIGDDIELETVLDPLVGPVKVDTGQLEQVIMNLAINARDAMPEGGKLRIATSAVHVEESAAQTTLGVPAGRYAVLTVADAGTGMDTATRARVFEPFFTTKPEGQGTGLGLATVYGIVKQSGGSIQLSSEPGRGTTFEIYLPQVVKPAAERRAPNLASSADGGETLLVVEDEDAVRTLTCNILRKRGYSVLAAKNGGEALDTCRRHEGPIHLLVTDIVLPAMNGEESAAQISALRPAMRILFVSGYAAAAVGQQRREFTPGVGYLAKPFTAQTLANKVREVLDAV
jgi:PAS domain S-box-containing protein